MRATTTTLLGLVGLSLHFTFAFAHHSSNEGHSNLNPERNTSINACDSPGGTLASQKSGKAVAWSPDGTLGRRQSDDPVFYLSPGESACGSNYTDADAGACLDPGWIDGGYINKCNAWIRVELPSLGTKVDVRVLDSCSEGNPNIDSFGCNDVYLTLSSYSALAQGSQKIIDDGHLPGPVNWFFLDQEPCFACQNGLPGMKPSGGVDNCMGPDHDGVIRHGRKKGPERRFGPAAGEACSGLTGGLMSDHHIDYVQMFKQAAIKHGYKLDGGKGDDHHHQQRSLPAEVRGRDYEVRGGGGGPHKAKKKPFSLLDKSENFAAKLLRNSAAEEGYE